MKNSESFLVDWRVIIVCMSPKSRFEKIIRVLVGDHNLTCLFCVNKIVKYF